MMRIRARLPQLVWLTLVWVLLWGTFSVKSMVGGVIVAVLVTAVFPLPLIGERLPVRPLRLLRLFNYLAYDLVVSSIEISWETLRYGPRTTAGIVAVPLQTESALVAAAVADAVSLAPGTFVLQIDRRGKVCYVYTLGVRRPDDAERVRRDVLAMQRRVIRALGSRTEIAMITTDGGTR
ncbi:MAG: Na+/H+ antiporter subunit E [Pseudonocardiales bacterium]